MTVFVNYTLQIRGKDTKNFSYTQAREGARTIFPQKASNNTQRRGVMGEGWRVMGKKKKEPESSFPLTDHR